MPSIHLPAAKHKLQPWKNGLGVSRTIAEFPPGAGFDSVEWQVGSTEIGADCPFSDLPGLDRHFMVIEGAGVELACEDDTGEVKRSRIDKPYEPFAFRGDWRTSCRLLNGPVRVFNVVTRRGAFTADMEILRFQGPISLKKFAGEILLAVELNSLDARLAADQPEESFKFPGAGMLALVRIRSA